jgi:hypothetical protein
VMVRVLRVDDSDLLNIHNPCLPRLPAADTKQGDIRGSCSDCPGGRTGPPGMSGHSKRRI